VLPGKEEVAPAHKRHEIRKFDEDPSSSGVLFGLVAFVQVTLHTSMIGLTMTSIDFTSWWNAGVSVSFLLAVTIMGAELILWPLSFIDSTLASAFLFWSQVALWHMTTTFWSGPVLMLVAELAEPEKMPDGASVMFALELLFGAGSTAMLWINFPLLSIWLEEKYPEVIEPIEPIEPTSEPAGKPFVETVDSEFSDSDYEAGDLAKQIQKIVDNNVHGFNDVPTIVVPQNRNATEQTPPPLEKKKDANGNMDDWFFEKWGA